MLILKGTKDWGTIDEKERTAFIKGKKHDLPGNAVISEGDVVSIRNEKYDVLPFNPTLYQHISMRKAQIIQPADASYIIAKAGIRSGSRVLESGVGSGALSSYILWAVGKEGSLTSIDLDREAIEITEKNLSKFFDLSNWNRKVGDIKVEQDIAGMDAVVLDIIDPWNAISSAKRILEAGGSLVTYSPTFNQTERTVTEMKKQNMAVIETTEITKRDLIVRDGSTRPDHNVIGHTAFLTFGIKRSNIEIKV